MFSTVGGFHQYRGGYSVQWRDIISTEDDSTVEDVQYSGRISSARWKAFSTVDGYIISTEEDVQYSGRIASVQ